MERGIEMVFKNIATLVMVSVITSSCALWPYKKDFDCPIKEGLKCKSLYEISEMADKGMFGPNAVKPADDQNVKSRRFRTRNRGICNAC